MKMNITKIIIIYGQGADTLLFQTDLPESTWPYTGFFGFKAEAAAGTGLSYVQEHFPGVETTVVDVPRMRPSFKD